MGETKEQRRRRLVERYVLELIRPGKGLPPVQSIVVVARELADLVITETPGEQAAQKNAQTIAQELLRLAREAWQRELVCADHNEIDYSIFERGFFLGWRASERQNDKGDM